MAAWRMLCSAALAMKSLTTCLSKRICCSAAAPLQILFETIPATLYSALSRGSERPECSEERPEKRPRGAEPAAPSVPDECSGAGRGSEQQAPAGGLFLFNEQFVVKPPRSAARFAWHTDEEEQMGMCLRPPDAPYLVRLVGSAAPSCVITNQI